jgi:thiol-disulfide isomerase/thioredoxin
MRVSRVPLLAESLLVLLGLCATPLPAAAGTKPPTRELVDPADGATRSGKPSPAPQPSAARPPAPAGRGDEELQLVPEAKRIMPPPLPADLEWVRGIPLSLESLKGRVVLIEVWESSCVNCIRSLPAISRLHALYSRYRFIAIGIHSPEYGFNASRAAVDRASRRFGLEFPVASDTRRSFWNSWDVQGWPTTYLLDAHGRLAHLHQGEFTAAAMERRIRRLMLESFPDLPLPGIAAMPPDRDAYAPECGFVTPEIPTRPGLDFLLNPEGYREGETVLYADPGSARSEGTLFLKGPWAWLENGLQRGTAPAPAAIGITYSAKEVYAVLALSGDLPQEIEVRQDGKPLTMSNRGTDIEFTRDGRSIVRLKESRLHYLVVNSDVSRHDLELFPQNSGFTIHNFSFGNRCQTDFPHR